MTAPRNRAELVEAMARAMCCSLDTCCFHDLPDSCEYESHAADVASALTVLDRIIPPAALDALLEGSAVVVPRVETEAQEIAGETARKTWTTVYLDGSEVAHSAMKSEVYRAMIAASPFAQEPGQ